MGRPPTRTARAIGAAVGAWCRARRPSQSSDTTVSAAADTDPDPVPGAWLRPISRGNWHFNGWRLSFSESGPRLKSRSLHHSALEKMTNLSRTESPRRGGRIKSNHDRRRHVEEAAAESGRGRRGAAMSRVWSVVLLLNPRAHSYIYRGSRTSILPPPMLNNLSSISVWESRIQYLCDPQWFRDTASRGHTTVATPKTHFRTDPSDHGKAPSKIDP
ncbi:hypothetical protein F511_19441 [Dorcoceras hygrometricum]|uniref:Uncharacterized protein n=1 Tax=Dorcoceras hygrometricum TaxID=472368 RepID=A0A2Z7DB04_9LAMI|nr:hypothetical protein F511_19441 [Dorcoceras hygrometricum]